MRVLPVMDLKGGQVVHARAGRRDEYPPLQSVWTEPAADPLRLAEALRDRFGIREWYVADLDALEGFAAQHQILWGLVAAGFQLWLDGGVREVSQAITYLSTGIHRLIVASETLPDVSLLSRLCPEQDSTHLVFSVDLKHREVCTVPGVFPNPTPRAVAETAIAMGINQLIVLDTAAVGKSQGPVTAQLCQALRKHHPSLTIISGGGIRHQGDLDALQAAGVDIALVGTALHSSRDFAEAVFSVNAGVQGNG